MIKNSDPLALTAEEQARISRLKKLGENGSWDLFTEAILGRKPLGKAKPEPIVAQRTPEKQAPKVLTETLQATVRMELKSGRTWKQVADRHNLTFADISWCTRRRLARLPDSEYAKAKALIAAGETIKATAEKLGIDPSNLAKHSRIEGWKRGRQPFYNLTGQRFGKLIAKFQVAKRMKSNRYVVWQCVCDCGQMAFVASKMLREGHTKSCGCLKRETHNVKDLVGKRFNKVVVLKRVPKPKGVKAKKAYWLVQCDCGKTAIRQSSNLTTGHTKTCGKCDNLHRTGKVVDMIGKTYGYLTVVRRGGYTPSYQVEWICKCTCGKEKAISGVSLRTGKRKSCGCRMGRPGVKKGPIPLELRRGRKLTYAKVAEIKEFLRYDTPVKDIAEMYNVTTANILLIKRKKIWEFVP